MKINASRHSAGQRGNVLIITLVFFGIVALTTASYLVLAHSRMVLRARNLTWNTAMPLAEAGVEEAMAHLIDDTNAAANGWTAGTVGGQAVYWKQRNFSDGSYFYVTLYNATTNSPYIYSTGFLPAPLQAGGYISRTVRVTCTNLPLVSVAFAAKYDIRMTGNGVAADSFNSNDPALSTNGQYDPSKTSTNGNVASQYGPVSIGNHSIAGSLYLGPTASSTVNASQVLGDIYTNSPVAYADATLPTNTTWSPATTTLRGLSLVHDFTTSGDYYINDLLPTDIYVEPGVTVRLRVDNSAYASGTINVLSTNNNSGTLKIYQVSGSTVIGNVNVDSGRARNFYYYGLPGVTSITYGGNSTFIGVIYAPEADLTLNGGGSGNGLIGSSITRSITMHGHFNFHFDEDLLTSGPTLAPTPSSWQEL